MRVGVFGCGYWGSKHVRVLSGLPEVDLVVAIDPMLERTKALQRAFPGLLCVEDFEQALDFIETDELVEVTPVAFRMRKRLLKADERGKAKKRSAV